MDAEHVFEQVQEILSRRPCSERTMKQRRAEAIDAIHRFARDMLDQRLAAIRQLLEIPDPPDPP